MSARAQSPELDLSDTNAAATLAVLLVPERRRVLACGAAPGVVRALEDRGCSVVTLDTQIPSMELVVDTMSAQGIDVVLLLGVLERVGQPVDLLRRIRDRLEPEGCLVTVLPNVTHAAVRLELLRGAFPYRPNGLLAHDHLRFFDARGIEALFREAGLLIDEMLRETRAIDETEFELDVEELPPEVLSAATADDDALVYRFVVMATPVGEGRAPRATAQATLLERLQMERDRLRRELRVAAEEAAAERTRDRAELEQHLRAQADELETLLRERRQLQRDLVVKEEYLVALRERIGHGLPGEADNVALRYRLADSAADALEHVPLVARVARWAARRLG